MAWLLAAASALAVAFAAGDRWGRLKASLQVESRYPWDLHRKMATADLRCEGFSPNEGAFRIQTMDGGKTLIVGTLNRSTGEATVIAIDERGKFATDTFGVDCPKQPK